MSADTVVVGLRGSFVSTVGPASLDASEAWRVAGLHGAPWGACDYAHDYESEGADVLRSWLHVGLDGSPIGRVDEQLPVVLLALVLADALAAQGTFALTGLDATVPLAAGCRLRPSAGSGAIAPARRTPPATFCEVVIQIVPTANAHVPKTTPEAGWAAALDRMTADLILAPAGPCDPIRINEGPFRNAYDDPPRVRLRLP